MERIVIKNFGPIKDVDLEINDFMIFIGPQASGKSTIAKLVYFFKNLPNELKIFLFDNSLQKVLEKVEGNTVGHIIGYHFTYLFPELKNYKNAKIDFYFRDDFVISMIIEDFLKYSISMPDKFIEGFEITLKQANDLFLQGRENFPIVRNSITVLADNFINKAFDKGISDNLFIPAGRGFISTISSQIFNLKTENLDYFIREFASTIRFIQNNILLDESNLQHQSEELKEKYLSIYNLIRKLQLSILKGRYLFDEKNEKIGIEIGESNFIPLDIASSGQQEAVWVVQYLISKIHQLSARTSFTVIEEPEAHLYPESQKSIMELITLFVNLPNNQVIITTHSPYILASVNNLLYANKVGKTHEKEVAEKIDKNLWLDYKRVGAYFVGGEDNEGRIKRIMDDELELIENQYIDSASSIINQEFDFIFALED